MSLTSLLKGNADVRLRFRTEFPKPKFHFDKAKPLLVEPHSNRFSLMGTAFDYVLRFQIQRLNPKKAKTSPWVAALATDESDKRFRAKASNIIKTAEDRLKRYLKTGDLSDGLIESSVLLAQLDTVFRSGLGQQDVGIVHKEDVRELRALAAIVPLELFKAKRQCLLNPTFGSASHLIGGADADIIIDGTLIDVKTTKAFAVEEKHHHQLMGYYILSVIEGDGTSMYGIERLGIYFSRQAHLEVWPVRDVVVPSRLPAITQWLQTRCLM